MGTFVNLIFFGISFISLAVAGGFGTNSAVRITGISGWDKNSDLKTAHKYLSIAAVVCWITVAFILVGIILYLFVSFNPETAELGALSWKDYVIYGLLFLSLAATIVVGILSALGAQKIGDAKGDDNGSRKQAIIAAVLAIVTAVGLIAALIAMFVHHSSKKDDKSKTNSKEKELETLLLAAE